MHPDVCRRISKMKLRPKRTKGRLRHLLRDLTWRRISEALYQEPKVSPHHGLDCEPYNSDVEAQTPSVTIFGARAFKEQVKVK